jgi:hypothetical protein
MNPDYPGMHKETSMFTSTPSQSGRGPRRGRLLAALLAIAGLVPLASHAVSSVQVQVPVRTAPKLQLSAVRVTLQLNDSTPIALSISSPGGTVQATGSMNLTNNTADCFPGSVCFFDFPAPGGGGAADALLVIKPLHAGADPASTDLNKVVLLLQFPRVDAASCTAGISAPENWTISVVGGADRITGVAVQSLDKATTVPPACSTAFRPVPLNDTPFAQALDPAPVLSGRVGVDTVLVLDHSGSMSSRSNPADAASLPKIDRLHSAAGNFFTMWQQLRANETAQLIQSPAESAGVVFFDHTAKWLQTVVPGSQIDGLRAFETLNIANEVTNIAQVGPSGATSIGGGLVLAANALPSPAGTPNRKVILLMSDGMQNSDPIAQVTGSQVQTDTGGTVSPLPNQPPAKIYSVTVGTGLAVDPTINQAVATASGGFYLNLDPSVSDAALNNFFVQVLQNMHKYSTVETQRIVSDTTDPTAPFTMQFPVTTTTTSLALSLNWSDQRRRLRVQLTPPGATQPIQFVPSGPPAGTLTGGLAFPAQGVPQSAGLWTLRVIATGEDSTQVPFNLMVLADDAALNSSLGIVSGEHAVGGTIQLTAQVNDLGKPLAGLGAQPNARVEAFIVKPGNSLGDVLSAEAVQPAAPTAGDNSSEAQRKLEALLAENPGALKRGENRVTLVDDGSAASGDEQANDGRYSAVVPADFEGHYQVVFYVEADSASGGRFVRQQVRTAHVRSLPAPGNTTTTTQVTGGPTGSVLVVTLTPMNLKNQLLGPGFANYFWFKPDGGAPVKGVDNLNGTYTANIPFSGSEPPKVSVHFLDEPVFRGDGFVPTPEILTADNTVVPEVVKAEKPWWLKYWWVLLILLILIILILLLRRRGP